MSIASADPPGLRRYAAAACLAVLALLVVAAYLPGIGGGFAFDDYPNIVANTALQTGAHWQDWIGAALSSPARDLPRPLAMLSLALDWRLGAGHPLVFKLTNIAIHAGNLVLAYLLARALFSRAGDPVRDPRAAALLVAGAWALHPINATSVLYIVQRMESMSHFFVFAGLCCYCWLRARQQRVAGGWAALYATVGGFTFLGILAKESAALLPVYALCIEAWLFRFEGEGARRRLAWLYALLLVLPALLGLAYLLPRALGPHAYGGREFDLVERLLTEPRVLCEYLRWILVPDLSRLGFYHDDIAISRGLLGPPTTLLAILFLAALAVAAWLGRRRWPLATLGVAWFLCAHLLTGTFLPLELVFEHRNYFASFGVCLAVVGAFEQVTRGHGRARWRWVLGAGAGLVLVLGVMTCLRAREWGDPFTFARSEAARNPASPRATYYYGWVLANATGYRADSPRIDAAIAALEAARAVPGAGPLPDHALMILAARTGRPVRDEWWQHMAERLRSHPIGAQESGALASLTNCQIAKQCRFSPDRMMLVFTAALSQGDNPLVMNSYANYALNELNDVDLAFRLWSEARRMVPAEPQFRISIAKLLVATGRYADAEAEIRGLEALGRAGQYRREAAELRERLASARAAR